MFIITCEVFVVVLVCKVQMSRYLFQFTLVHCGIGASGIHTHTRLTLSLSSSVWKCFTRIEEGKGKENHK